MLIEDIPSREWITAKKLQMTFESIDQCERTLTMRTGDTDTTFTTSRGFFLSCSFGETKVFCLFLNERLRTEGVPLSFVDSKTFVTTATNDTTFTSDKWDLLLIRCRESENLKKSFVPQADLDKLQNLSLRPCEWRWRYALQDVHGGNTVDEITS